MDYFIIKWIIWIITMDYFRPHGFSMCPDCHVPLPLPRPDVLAQERWRAKPGCRPGHNGPRSCPQCLVPTVPTACQNRRAESNPFTKTHVIPCPDVIRWHHSVIVGCCLMNLMRCEACCASFLSKNPKCWWPSFFGQGVDVSIIPSVVVTELAYPTLKIDGNRSMIPRDFRILEPVWLIHQRKIHMM